MIPCQTVDVVSLTVERRGDGPGQVPEELECLEGSPEDVLATAWVRDGLPLCLEKGLLLREPGGECVQVDVSLREAAGMQRQVWPVSTGGGSQARVGFWVREGLGCGHMRGRCRVWGSKGTHLTGGRHYTTSSMHILSRKPWIKYSHTLHGGSSVNNPPANIRDTSLIPGSWRSPGEGNGNLLQYSSWEIPWTEELARLQSMW